MGSQFVDLDADGHLDYLTATYDGSPHVAWGSEAGFGEPERLRDRHGERLIVSAFWDYDAEQHLTSGRAVGGDELHDERLISAYAFDWDADGDLDLLLGTYENGHLYLQRNEGTAKEAVWTGVNEPVMAGDVPFSIPGKMTAPRLVDWDSDGDLDIVAGGFDGGVWLSLNEGKVGEPRFGALQTLVAKPTTGGVLPTEPTAPVRGLYVEPIDHDGDGDLDLVVGGYAEWEPEGRELTAEEEARVAELRALLATMDEKGSAIIGEMSKAVDEAIAGMDPGSEEAEAKAAEVREPIMERYFAVYEKQDPLRAELDGLVPRKKSESGIWLYERR